VVPKLQSRNTDEFHALAARAETGMRIIKHEAIQLAPPDPAMLEETYETLKSLHRQAYGWDPPDLPPPPRRATRAMRSYVRRWINEWDLRRLDPGQRIETVENELTIDFRESPELQTAAEDGQTDVGDNE
jgi:hypothetical protein